jgi:hypothetical protein
MVSILLASLHLACTATLAILLIRAVRRIDKLKRESFGFHTARYESELERAARSLALHINGSGWLCSFEHRRDCYHIIFYKDNEDAQGYGHHMELYDMALHEAIIDVTLLANRIKEITTNERAR